MTLSQRFEAELCEIVVKGGRLTRYAACAWRTIAVMRQRKPDVLFVQSPSVVLAAIAVTVGRLFCGTVVIDAHNAGIFPLEGKSRLLNGLCRTVLKVADHVIVSNEELRSRLGLPNVLVLPDPLPPFSAAPGLAASAAAGGRRPVPDVGVFRATYITSWAADEPYGAVIEAASALPPGFEVRATGRAPASVAERSDLPAALRLLGFLDDDAYFEELSSTDLIMVLTTREACLTCGAYEAVSLEKPLMLSATSALEGYFGEAATYVLNSPDEIRRGLVAGRYRLGDMQQAAARVKPQLAADWDLEFNKIKDILSGRAS